MAHLQGTIGFSFMTDFVFIYKRINRFGFHYIQFHSRFGFITSPFHSRFAFHYITVHHHFVFIT